MHSISISEEWSLMSYEFKVRESFKIYYYQDRGNAKKQKKCYSNIMMMILMIHDTYGTCSTGTRYIYIIQYG